MKRFFFNIPTAFVFISCGAIVNKALQRTGVLEDTPFIEYRSSDTKEIAFIHMHHIGTEPFYHTVANKVDSLQRKGYISFYEGVANAKEIDSIENDIIERKVRKIIGLVPQNYYDSISNKIAGRIKYKGDKKLINQPTYSQLNVDTITAVKADVELKLMIEKFEQDYGVVELTECDRNTSLNNKKYECKVLKKDLSKKFREEIILNYRNEYLANQIVNTKSDKILVIYGANHFKGLWMELDKIDSTWNYDESYPDYIDRNLSN